MRVLIVALICCLATMALADPQNMQESFDLKKLPQPVQEPADIVQFGAIYVLESESCEDGTPQLRFPPKSVTGEITNIFGEDGIMILKAEKFPETIETEYWFENGYLYNRNVSTEEAVPSVLMQADGKLVWYSALPLDKEYAEKICAPGNNYVKTVYVLQEVEPEGDDLEEGY